jgi:hypothetical protein
MDSKGNTVAAGWFASTIAHEGKHIELYKEGGALKSRGSKAEIESLKFQLEVGRNFRLTIGHLRYLSSLQGKGGDRWSESIEKPKTRSKSPRVIRRENVNKENN